ncbi:MULTISPECIES: GntR family transcriptional regulator [unclassified Sinorhizobium]|uniref:GntR family transcriptional regulator n=1 Tax=unclassified Sinorhizobium TaxID=2613772 RepID=UPI0024C24ACA|nr:MULTISPECIES: GntR family transcriptional regulator [unclassified Sinorhizobium]MDK1378287.1 GntR family transcriptional regulator [Sinorhizobium sp. 6-70]MDK1482270.1 GntR family transcriptional regulator [Sinorhizobium sp. 6-117]
MSTKRPYRTEQIANWIRDEIMSGALLPGSRLEERPISERFGVSKTPVREALIQLSTTGLVELRQRRGAIVTVLSVEQVVSMFEVMTELESMAANFAALRMSPADREELAKIHRRGEECIPHEDFEKYDVINKEFHEQIYRGSCNEYLEANIKDVRRRLGVYRRYPFQKPGRILQSFSDHGQVIAAISKGDGEAAGKIMRDHISSGGRVFADLVVEMRRQS